MDRPIDRPRKPPGLPRVWLPEDTIRTVRKPGDPANHMSWPSCWVWSERDGEWKMGRLRSWHLTRAGWWAAVDVSGSVHHVHQWRLRPWSEGD